MYTVCDSKERGIQRHVGEEYMKKFEFTIEFPMKREIVEGESADDARERLINTEKYDPEVYISDGKEIKADALLGK